jgi:hypothetical protein
MATIAKRRGGTRGPETVRAKYKDSANYAVAEAIPADKPLTDQQKRFVKFWAEGESKSNAAIKAGYSEDNVAFRLVRMPNILALKAKYEAQYEKAAEMDRKQVMEGFKEAIEMAKLMADPTAMISGWREIGKMCGYYAPVETKLKIDVTGNVTMTRLTQMTDAELLELIEKGSQASSPQLIEGQP